MKLIPVGVANKFGRPLLHLQKQSPQLMFAGGIVAAVTGTVLACRATLKLSDVLDDAAALKEKAELLHDDWKKLPTDDGYDDKQYAKDLTVIKVKTILNVTKLYAPSAGLMMLSVALLTGSHVTLNRRNASLTAAYVSVDQAFEKYRAKVVEKLGADADREFRYDTEIVEEKVEGEDGKKKTVKHTRVSTDGMPSLYARFFDEGCPDWKRNPELNKIFLRAQQNYANDRLKARGHLFLNEVYDSLGIERTPEGQVVGWVLDGKGDGFVDFGIYDDLSNPHVRDFVNGREYSVLLDFNVDGLIYNKI